MNRITIFLLFISVVKCNPNGKFTHSLVEINKIKQDNDDLKLVNKILVSMIKYCDVSSNSSKAILSHNEMSRKMILEKLQHFNISSSIKRELSANSFAVITYNLLRHREEFNEKLQNITELCVAASLVNIPSSKSFNTEYLIAICFLILLFFQLITLIYLCCLRFQTKHYRTISRE